MVKLKVVLCACVMTLPTLALAQGTAGISGQVKDATGGVLPGVTVEASSPALIEKTRVAKSSRGELDASGHDEDGWRTDRRVDIVLL